MKSHPIRPPDRRYLTLWSEVLDGLPQISALSSINMHRYLGGSPEKNRPIVDQFTENNYFFLVISIACTPPGRLRHKSHVNIELEEVLHPDFFNAFYAGQHASHYGGTGIPEPVTGLRRHCVSDGVDGITGGLQFPSSTIQRAWHRIGNRKCRAIQPVSNAYEA